MKKKLVHISLNCCFFLLGFLCCMLWGKLLKQAEPADTDYTAENIIHEEVNYDSMLAEARLEVKSDTLSRISVRVRNDIVEWFDGTRWNEVQTVEELRAGDSIQLGKDNAALLEQQLLEERRAESEQTGNSILQAAEACMESATPKKQPKPTTPTTTAPKEQATDSSVESPTGNSQTEQQPTAPSSQPTPPNNNISDGENAGGSSGTPDTDGTATPPDSSDTSTGDGENMEWSDDYL